MELAMKLAIELNYKIDKLFYFEKDWFIELQITAKKYVNSDENKK